MEERVIVFKCYGEEDIYIQTNAPKQEIKNALIYRDTMRGQEQFNVLSDFEIIQNYLEEKDYVFYDIDIKEKYYW